MHAWRKHEKALYLPPARPQLVDVPTMRFAVVSGRGDPNEPAYAAWVQALYAVSYRIKMGLRQHPAKPSDHVDWSVYPLEGVWDVSDEVKRHPERGFTKADLVFDLMIRQPRFASEALFSALREEAARRTPNRHIPEVRLEDRTEGRCVQMLHVGPYDDEPASFEIMERFAADLGLVRASKVHREIYLSDPRRVPPARRKTVLRFQVSGAT